MNETANGAGFSGMLLALSLIISAALGFWAGKVGKRRGRSFGLCFALGFLLGVIGVLIVYLLGSSRAKRPSPPGRSIKVCRYCGKMIPSGDEPCVYCGRDSPDGGAGS